MLNVLDELVVFAILNLFLDHYVECITLRLPC